MYYWVYWMKLRKAMEKRVRKTLGRYEAVGEIGRNTPANLLMTKTVGMV